MPGLLAKGITTEKMGPLGFLLRKISLDLSNQYPKWWDNVIFFPL
jgi:hypothetical protein